ncbi:hypothetical protein BDV32DRAFT_147497 [Aspergillus pseudonomiae]|uniref:Uncharacterized protein n=1 Tax=Aspergillus pseudonomiae TaxID=1506151 RepID=A0A5N6I7K7_9EURO|nr:uncharacterized protein BDV37DRAFT_285861 [Aspergillus pseudonomiae]KAB8262576.1 hypothetical protein BDV32DRAFT_147497 [Aspergillus pseudonomiae]KAE8401162.1 hypothetical protein BDV37DRAFT_285861 [Aspergillus pseudonomiae]
MPFTIDTAQLWAAVVLVFTWNVLNLQNPVIKVLLDWLSVRLQLWLDRRWCAFARRGGVQRSGQAGGRGVVVVEGNEESVGDEDEVWWSAKESVGERREESVEEGPDSPGNGPPANSRNTIHNLVGHWLHRRDNRRRRDLESGLFYRGRSRSPRPVARRSPTTTNQPDTRGVAGAGELNAIISGLLPASVGVDTTGGQT